MVAQSIPVSAFIYETQTTLNLSNDGLDAIATVTNTVLTEIFSDFFRANPNVDFLSAETSRYRSLGQNNIFRFDSTILFNEGFTVPSEQELQDVVDHEFAPGASAAILYLDKLHFTGDPGLADIEGVSFIGSEEEIETLSANAKEQETKGNVKVSVPTLHQYPENEVESVNNFDLLFLRVILVTSMVLFTLFLVYMEARRQNALLGRNLDENIMKPRTEKDEPTYRTDLFPKGARKNDIESYDEASIGDDSYSMTSDASASPPTSPFRTELYTALRREPEGPPAKPAWATRNRTPNSASKPQIHGDSQVQGTALTQASFLGGTNSEEDSDIIEMESSSEDHSTEEVERMLSIPMLNKAKEYIVDNQDLASNSSTEYSVPGRDSKTADPKFTESSTSVCDHPDQEENDEEKSISLPIGTDGNTATCSTEKTTKATGAVKTNSTGPALQADQQDKMADSAFSQPSPGQPVENTDSPHDAAGELPEEQSSEPEWMKKFKKMGLNAP